MTSKTLSEPPEFRQNTTSKYTNTTSNAEKQSCYHTDVMYQIHYFIYIYIVRVCGYKHLQKAHELATDSRVHLPTLRSQNRFKVTFLVLLDASTNALVQSVVEVLVIRRCVSRPAGTRTSPQKRFGFKETPRDPGRLATRVQEPLSRPL